VTAIRTCVGCGVRAGQASLLRFTLRDGVLRVDGHRRGTGRGAYLHAERACWERFRDRRGPVRSLRAGVPRPARERLLEELRSGRFGGEHQA
jgi:predicted RNA-binding protein YlxR (DUF448 family)